MRGVSARSLGPQNEVFTKLEPFRFLDARARPLGPLPAADGRFTQIGERNKPSGPPVAPIPRRPAFFVRAAAARARWRPQTADC